MIGIAYLTYCRKAILDDCKHIQNYLFIDIYRYHQLIYVHIRFLLSNGTYLR